MVAQQMRISPDVLFQEVSGEMVLLDLESETYFGLDEIGARIWTRLSEGDSPAQIVNRLLDEYEVDRNTLEKDVAALLGSLVEAGLVTVSD